jgi:hypothetical protein
MRFLLLLLLLLIGHVAASSPYFKVSGIKSMDDRIDEIDKKIFQTPRDTDVQKEYLASLYDRRRRIVAATIRIFDLYDEGREIKA